VDSDFIAPTDPCEDPNVVDRRGNVSNRTEHGLIVNFTDAGPKGYLDRTTGQYWLRWNSSIFLADSEWAVRCLLFPGLSPYPRSVTYPSSKDQRQRPDRTIGTQRESYLPSQPGRPRVIPCNLLPPQCARRRRPTWRP
jgi:hypothetical protein